MNAEREMATGDGLGGEPVRLDPCKQIAESVGYDAHADDARLDELIDYKNALEDALRKAVEPSGDHLDFVEVVEVHSREDGIYVFADLSDAERFEAAVAAGRNLPDENESATYRRETPINVGEAAGRLVAAERGDVIEDIGWPSVAEDVREGVPLSTVRGRALATIDNDELGDVLPLLERWAKEDEG